jgi:two-component system cell cycle response regulator
VASAEEALELLDRPTDEEASCGAVPQGAYDVLITDFQLRKEMSGGDLLHALRARYSYSRQELPVLMITGSEDIRTQVEAFHSGANDFVNKPLVEEILIARIHSLLLIKQQYDALEQQASKMEELATRDSLTGVHNRHYLMAHGEAMYAAPENRPFWVMIIDIDHFKQINDNRGHLVGDRVLAALGAMLQRVLQGAMVVRFGGEEFAVLLPGYKRKKVQKLAEQVRATAESLRPDDVPVTISIGIAGTKDHLDVDLNTLIGLADQALYASKAAGRNRVAYTSAEGEPIFLSDAS